jgi:hypothetical protein
VATCPSCGNEVLVGDAFCSRCGGRLNPSPGSNPFRLPLVKGFLEADGQGVRIRGPSRIREIPWAEIAEVGTALRGGPGLGRVPGPGPGGMVLALLYIRASGRGRGPREISVAQDEVVVTPELMEGLRPLYQVPGKDPPYHLLALAVALKEIASRARPWNPKVVDRLDLMSKAGPPKG